MRHLRMAVLCLVAVFALSATTLVVASPASASCNTECKEQKEKAQAEKAFAKNIARREKWEASRVGDPYSANTWGQFSACEPEYEFQEPPGSCYTGITLGGKQGGSFEFGKVVVPLSKSIVLQGTFDGAEESSVLIPAVNGYQTLDAPELPVTGGIKLFDKSTQEQEEWPAALTESWKEAIKNKEAGVNVKIEMAGNECFEVMGCLNTSSLLEETGNAFKLPLKVKVTAPWLEKLGSEPCYIGNDANPIHIHLTTEGAGTAGQVEFNNAFDVVAVDNSRLVDVGWKIEPGSYPSGCTGPYASYLDNSLKHVLELDLNPHKKGIVVLKGDLYTGIPANVAKQGKESGELHNAS